MKIARLDQNKMIVEIFETKGLDKKFHADFIKTLQRVPEDAEVGKYFVGKKLVDPPPDNESILEGEKWVKNPAIEAEKDRSDKIDKARKRLKDLSAIQDEATRSAIKDLFLLIKAGED